MKNLTRKQQAIAYIEQLSPEKLEAALDYLADLSAADVKLRKSRKNADPLLALLGTLKFDVSDVSQRHDDYIADLLLAELRGNVDE